MTSIMVHVLAVVRAGRHGRGYLLLGIDMMTYLCLEVSEVLMMGRKNVHRKKK